MKISSGVIASAVFLGVSLAAGPANADAGEKARGSGYFESEVSEQARMAPRSRELSGNRAERKADRASERILMWFDVMLDTHAISQTPGQIGAGQQGGPLRSTRGYAMTMIAVFDAVNAFEGKYLSYGDIPLAEREASIDAAIAYAAHDVMVRVWSQQAARLDQILADDLASINASAAAKAKGRAVGQAAALAILDKRMNLTTNLADDGAQITEVSWGQGGSVATGNKDARGFAINSGQTGAFQWTPDPETNNQLALGANWGAVTPFVLSSGAQFRAGPFAASGTARYRGIWEDVKAVGATTETTGSTSTARTQFIGNYWGYEGTPLLGAPPRLYNQIAVELAERQKIDEPIELARYLALVNISMADAGIAVWDTKYFYNYWRPVTALRSDDGDAATQSDPDWTPFGISRANLANALRVTPDFPAYSSGHAAFGSAMFETARGFMPDNTAFTFVSEEYNGETADPFNPGIVRPLVPVRFASLKKAELENARSRVYNGSHWQLDSDVGARQGQQVARYARAKAFKRP